MAGTGKATVGPRAEVVVEMGLVLGGTYTILHPLGKGGMGRVYLARQTRLERNVAIKVLNKEFADRADTRARFVREAKIVAKLKHHGIVRIIDDGELTDGRPYYVMEHLDGGDLATAIENSPDGRPPLRQTLALLADVAEAMASVHEAGIVHRDLKPENIFLAEEQGGRVRPKIIDFGLGRVHDDEKVGPGSSRRLTETNMAFGTLWYMSPEQSMGAREAGKPTDVYALACILFEVVTGRPPFHAEDSTQTKIQMDHQLTPPPSARAVVPDLPEWIDALIQRGMAKNPDARPTMEEFRSALRAGLEEDILTETLPPPAPRLRFSFQLWHLLVLVIVGSGVTGALLKRAVRSTTHPSAVTVPVRPAPHTPMRPSVEPVVPLLALPPEVRPALPSIGESLTDAGVSSHGRHRHRDAAVSAAIPLTINTPLPEPVHQPPTTPCGHQNEQGLIVPCLTPD